jgi:hypothetical protein
VFQQPNRCTLYYIYYLLSLYYIFIWGSENGFCWNVGTLEHFFAADFLLFLFAVLFFIRGLQGEKQ